MIFTGSTDVRLESDVSGAACELIREEETITVNSLAESSVANLIHAHSKVLAVDYEVVTEIAGSDGDGFEIGVSGNTNAYAEGVALTVSTSPVQNVIPDADADSATAKAVLITITLTEDTPADAPETGAVRVGVWQLVFTAPSA